LNVYWLSAVAILSLTVLALAQILFVVRRLVDRLAESKHVTVNPMVSPRPIPPPTPPPPPPSDSEKTWPQRKED